MSTLKATNLQNASSSSTNLVLDTSGNATSAGTVVMSSPYTMRNKIINGAMVIDQRNAGAAITIAAGGTGYPVDRQYIENFQSGTITAQRSSTAPTGFTNSVIHTVTVTDTPAAGDYLFTSASVEGFNIADFGWGTANAQSVTLSFWVRSSVTGTNGIGLRNGAANYSYVATYTVNAANTWEQKTITIAGPTSGTWYSDNQLGVRIFFDLGSGSNFNGTANAWQSGTFWRTSGCVNWIGNAGATFYITGVQLERGTVATPFEYRNYQQELAMCQRYFQKSYDIETAVGTATYNGYLNWNWQNLSNYGTANIILPVRMRAAPTCTNYNPALTNTVGGRYWNGSAEVAFTGSMAGWDQYQSTIRFNKDATNSTNILIQWTASAEL